MHRAQSGLHQLLGRRLHVRDAATGQPAVQLARTPSEQDRFVGDLAQPDFLELHVIITPGAGFDPVGQPFTVSLSNSVSVGPADSSCLRRAGRAKAGPPWAAR